MIFPIDCHLYCLLTYVISTVTASRPGDLRDFCEEESFQADCPDGSAVLIDRATYGRMQHGRCILDEETGCSTDVRFHLDRWCSGRNKCQVPVTNLIQFAAGFCSRDRRSYLEAQYSCVSVLRGQDGSCTEKHTQEVASSTSGGFISSYVAVETGCGSLESPWHIRVPKGQRINVTLLDFSVAATGTFGRPGVTAAPMGGLCTVYAIIKEVPAGQTSTVCGGKARQTHGFLSVANAIDIRLIGKRRNDDNEPKFMLQYNVIGCRDPVLPAGAWMDRSEEEAVVRCRQVHERQWHLRCNGTDWYNLGPAPVACDQEEGKPSSGGNQAGVPMHFQGLSVIIIAAVAAMVGLLILLGGIGYLRRKRRLSKCPMGRRTRLEGGKLGADYEGDSLDVATGQPSKLCPSSVPTYLDSQSYVTNRWQPSPFLAPVVASSAAQTVLSTGRPGPTSAGTEYGTGTAAASVVRYSEHLYESPNFERKDVPLLSASLSRYDSEAIGRHCGERDGGAAVCALQGQGRRSLTDPVCAGN